MILHRITADRAFPSLASLGSAVLGMTVAATVCTVGTRQPSRSPDIAASFRERDSIDASVDGTYLAPNSSQPVSFRGH